MILESHPNTTAIADLMDTLSLSEYHVKKAIEDLMIDVKRLGLPVDLFEIEILDNKMISYIRKSSLSAFNYLLYIYSIESNFSPFFKNFLFESTDSQVNFLEENFLSKTNFFRLRQRFTETLKMFDIQMTAKVELLGSETNIRSFLYIYLLTSYGDVKRPFTVQLENDFDVIIDRIEQTVMKNFSTATRLKLQYYLYVIFVRSGLNHFLTETETDLVSTSDVFEELVIIINNYFDISSQVHEAQAVAKEILIFLFSEGIIQNSIQINKTFSIISDIREYFSSFFDLTPEIVNEIFTPSINLELSQFLVHICHLNYPINLLTNPKQISYLNDNFKEYQVFSAKIIHQLSQILPKRAQFISYYHDALTTDLLLLIIANFKISLITKPVVVTIDFSYGENYNKFIENDIKNFNALNLKVTNLLTTETDILISNLSPHVGPNVHKLQWTSPPSSSDWAFLGNLIVDIKKDRNVVHNNKKQGHPD